MLYKHLFNSFLRNEEGGDGGDGGGGTGEGQDSTIFGQGNDGQSQEGEGQQSSSSQANSKGGDFSFGSLLDDEGNFVPDWIDRLPEAQRDKFKENSKHYGKYKNPIHALEHTHSLQTLLGSKAEAMVMPAQDAPKEEWDAFFTKLGRPETPEGYNFTAPEGLHESIKFSEEDAKQFTNLAHEIGLTPQQVARLATYDMERMNAMAESNETEAQEITANHLAENKKTLEKSWGSGNDFSEKLEIARRAAMTFGYDSEALQSNPIFANAEVLMMLEKAGTGMREDQLVQGDDGSNASFKAKANDIINNEANPEYKKYWAGDEATVDKVRTWMGMS